MDLLLHDAAAAIERDATLRWRAGLVHDARITGLGSHREADERPSDAGEAPGAADR